MLGVGGFATVKLVQHKKSREFYALKCMDKARVFSTDHLKRAVFNEISIHQVCERAARAPARCHFLKEHLHRQAALL